MKLLAVVAITFIFSLPALGQLNTIDVVGNPQRTRVINTKGLETAPSQMLWKSERLFQYRATELVDAQMGPSSPFMFSIELPTNQDITVPIIAGDLLYFTYTARNGYVFAIEKATGKMLINLKFDNNSVSRPAAKDNIVFFGSARGQVHAYDFRKRETKWTFLDKDHSFAKSSPILDRDLLYFYAVDRGLYAFVVDTGDVKWLFKSENFVSAPAVAGDRVILVTVTGRLLALDRATGVKRWDVSVGRNTTAPAVLGEQIFLVYNDGEIRSYSAIDGSLQWKSKNVPRSGSGLALYNGLVYYTGRENDVIAIDATTGTEKLRFKTKRDCHSPLIAGELLYVRCRDYKLYALSTAQLTEVWSMQNGKAFPPVVLFEDGVMYSLGSDGYMHALK